MMPNTDLEISKIHRHFFNQAPVSLAIVSLDGYIWDTNTRFRKMFGFSQGELEGRPYSDLLHPEDHQKFETERRKLFAGEVGELKTVLKHIKNDGSIFSIVYCSHMLKEDGKIVSHQMIQLFESDVFDADEDMIREKIYIDSFVDGFSGSFYFKNIQGQFLKVNKGFLAKYGIENQEDIIGKTDFDILSPERANKAFSDEKEVIATGKPKENILEKEKRNNGSIIWTATTKMPLRNSKGTIVGTFGFSLDITKEKKHELELLEKTKILHAITENIPVAIYKYNLITGLVLLSGTNEVVSALQKSKVAKLLFTEAIKELLKKNTQKKDQRKHLHFNSANKERIPEQHFENYLFESDFNEEEYIGLALNITEKKQIELNLKRNAKNLEKINNELNQFAYIVSHDLKAPLRAISNLSEWIEEDLGETENEDIKDNLKLMRSRVKRMENLIQGVLSYSRASKTQVGNDEVNTKKLVKEIVDSLAIPESFQVKTDGNFPVVFCPKVHIEQVFTNLISNAVKYHDKQEGKIEIGYRLAKGHHQFYVADDGPGIAPEYHEKIFTIFQTLHARDAIESTGVGLSIVKKLVEGWGGEIKIKSTEGHGSKFIFTIPILNS